MSTGVPSGRYGMSSAGRILARAHPCCRGDRPSCRRPESLRFMATKTLTILMTPGGSSSPFCRSSTRSSSSNTCLDDLDLSLECGFCD